MSHLIIDENNYLDAIQQRKDQVGKSQPLSQPGCVPRRTAYGCMRHVSRATDIIKPLPREEWAGLVADGKGSFLHDLCKDHLPAKSQGNTNYCWAHGPTRAAEVLNMFQTGAPLILSAESVAVPITGGRNRGGNPEEALERLRSHGACKQSFWPLNDRDERNAETGWEADAAKHKLIRWVDVGDFDMQFTLALMCVPVGIGLSWWGHAVCQLDPVHFGGRDFGIGCDNSWGASYGDNGYFQLTERKGTSDIGAFAPITESLIELCQTVHQSL